MISAEAAACSLYNEPSRLDAFDSRGRIISAFAAALVVSSLHRVTGLAVASILPVLFLFVDGRGGLSPMLNALGAINKISVLVWVLLPVTYPGHRLLGFFSAEGAEMALFITWKMNLISIILIRLVTAMGTSRIDSALDGLHVPLKLRMLLILSVRYIFLLSERVATMTKAIGARAPKLGFMATLRVMACMIGTTLIHCADKAERSAKALRCRGGIGGFRAVACKAWATRDTALCCIFLAYFAAVAAMDCLWVL